MDKSKKHILIVEDERAISKALQLKLIHEGFEVDAAYNGQDGIDQAKSKTFDLILLDMVMPIKDGFAFLEETNAAGRKAPVIVLSNLSQPEDIQKAKSLGAVDFIVKSDTPLSDIVNLVNNVLK